MKKNQDETVKKTPKDLEMTSQIEFLNGKI